MARKKIVVSPECNDHPEPAAIPHVPNAVLLSRFRADAGVDIHFVLKSGRTHVRATVDGVKCPVPPLTCADLEKLGNSTAKAMNTIRESERAEELI